MAAGRVVVPLGLHTSVQYPVWNPEQGLGLAEKWDALTDMRRDQIAALRRRFEKPGELAMVEVDDLSRSSTALDQEKALICVVEPSRSSWLIAGMLPGIDRQKLKMLEPDPVRLR